MIRSLLKKRKDIVLERIYDAPIDLVWKAWTEPEMVKQWWGPDKTFVPECEVDARVGGRIHLVMEAGEKMGKYAGTRWPMTGTFTRVDVNDRLTYEARSTTEGEEDASTIEHINDVTFTESGGKTTVTFRASITEIGPKAKMAAFGMKWGYKASLDKLEKQLASV